MRIISRENVTLWTSAVLTYRINNLHTWAIENLDPLNILQGDYDGIVKDILQSHEVDRLVSDRESIKEEIFSALKSRPINEGGPTLEKKYGIEVVSFVLKETRFGDKLVEATEEKKRRELIAEAEIVKRLKSIHTYLQNPRRDPLLSVAEIFKKEDHGRFYEIRTAFEKIKQKIRPME